MQQSHLTASTRGEKTARSTRETGLATHAADVIHCNFNSQSLNHKAINSQPITTDRRHERKKQKIEKPAPTQRRTDQEKVYQLACPGTSYPSIYTPLGRSKAVALD